MGATSQVPPSYRELRRVLGDATFSMGAKGHLYLSLLHLLLTYTQHITTMGFIDAEVRVRLQADDQFTDALLLLTRNTMSYLFTSEPEAVRRQLEKVRLGLQIADEDPNLLEMKTFAGEAVLGVMCKWLQKLRVMSASLPGGVGVRREVKSRMLVTCLM